MKKLLVSCILCVLLFSACSSNDKEPKSKPEVSSIQITEAISNPKENPTLSTEEEQQTEMTKLSQEDIDFICNNLSYNVYSCKDGSQILEFYKDDTTSDAYIHYVPKKLPNGNYEFFQKISPSYNVSYMKDGSIEIPLCINDSVDYRFALKVEFSGVEGDAEINKKTITFLNKDDKDFNEMYAALDLEAQNAYCLSLTPDKSLSKEELASFLRACVYHGNMSVLDELYKLIPKDDLESRYKLELAGSMNNDSSISLSDENPYKSEIFYGESCEKFPQEDTISIVSQSLQTDKSLEKLGAEVVKPNYDFESVDKIPNSQDFYGYLTVEEKIDKIYYLDLDKDGLMEVLIFSTWSSSDDEFWKVLHLDKAGRITDINSGDGMRPMSLYRYHEDYFFLSNNLDFHDKEFLGWDVYALDKNTKMYRAYIYYDKIGSEIVFQDEHVKMDDFYIEDGELDTSIDTYKKYEYEALGKEIELDEKTKELFDEPYRSGGAYGAFDINNDKVDDWTYVYEFFPLDRSSYYRDYKFVDGKTNKLLDFSKLLQGQNICCIIPCRPMDKNYFICVLNGQGNYVIKLIEIKGIEPIELQSWLVSVKYRILINVSENTDSPIGP